MTLNKFLFTIEQKCKQKIKCTTVMAVQLRTQILAINTGLLSPLCISMYMTLSLLRRHCEVIVFISYFLTFNPHVFSFQSWTCFWIFGCWLAPLTGWRPEAAASIASRSFAPAWFSVYGDQATYRILLLRACYFCASWKSIFAEWPGYASTPS